MSSVESADGALIAGEPRQLCYSRLVAENPAGADRFPTTRWSLIAASRSAPDAKSREAPATLCNL